MGGDDENGCAISELAHPCLGLGGEAGIAGAKALVDQQDVRLDRGGDGEAEAHQHAGGIDANRQIEIAAEFGEIGDLSGACPDMLQGQAEVKATGNDILAAGTVDVEARRGIEQRGN